MSMMAGLVFGAFSAYGAYNISYNPKDIQVSLREYKISHFLSIPSQISIFMLCFTITPPPPPQFLLEPLQ